MNTIEEEPWFRYALIIGIIAILVLNLSRPHIAIDWPVVGLLGLMLLVFYFPSVSHIVLPGNIELRRDIDRTQRIVEASEEAAASEPQPMEAPGTPLEARVPLLPRQVGDEEEELLQLVQISPNAAIMEMGRRIEHAIQDLLTTARPDQTPQPRSVPLMLRRLVELDVLREGIAAATREIWQLRNRAVHGEQARPEDATRFLDLGFRVLGALRAGALTNWQVSAPRVPVTPGTVVQVGLRKKFGTEQDEYFFVCEVTDPNDMTRRAVSPLIGDSWSYVMYPSAFTAGGTDTPGEYTVRYRIADVLVAVDRFLVSGSR